MRNLLNVLLVKFIHFFIFAPRGCFNRGLMVLVHELLHTLGFVHEHTRPDRDNFISIHEENIKIGAKKNFVKRKQGYSDFFEKGSVNPKNTPYDVLSLLHYGLQDFSKNGEDVLTFLHELPGQTWQEPHPDDPLSVVDEVEILRGTFLNICTGGAGHGI